MRHSTMVVTVIACCVGIAITSCGKDKKASPTPRFISAWTNGISGKTFDSSSGQFSLVNNSEKTKLVNDLGWEEAENPDDYYDIIQQVEQRNAQLFVYHGHGRKGDETEGGEDANYSTQFKDASFIGMVPGGDFDPLEFELNPFKRAKAITPDLIKTALRRFEWVDDLALG